MNPADHLGDAISAASLVLAVLAALYSLWLADVSDALKIEPELDPADRGAQITQVKRAFQTKAAPLSVITVACAAILIPRGYAIIAEAHAIGLTGVFDDVKALFILTLTLLLLLATVAITQLLGLIAMLSKLGPAPQKP